MKYTLKELGKMLGISKRTAYELKRKGVLLMNIIKYLKIHSSIKERPNVKKYVYYSKDTELISETIKDKIWVSYIDGVN